MNALLDIQRLVECESPAEDLAACHKVIDLAVEIANLRLKPIAQKVIENGRPVFWWGADKPKIVLLCHLDTVWPIGSFQPTWRVSGDKASGPGVFDMKTGFVQAMHALIGIENAQAKVALVATTDEETGSATSKELINRLSKDADAVLVFEASLDGKVKTGRKGTAMYQVKVTGLASHAGLDPEKGINATTELAKLVLEIAGLENPTFGTTAVPTVMKSGTTTNTVPALATLDVDVRSFTKAELERIDSSIRNLKSATAKVEVTGGINRLPLEEASTLALYERLEKVAAALGMQKIGNASVGGASDGNLAASAGAKVLDGLGAEGHGAHAPSEFIKVSTVEPRIKLISAFINELMK
ncbi:MAG: M20 family metallopeptidase [Actinobacteria bacterium]|nr:M20 family metallopeptidase [Actinomycetota bacterium]